MEADGRERVRIVLVRARNPNNIGAAARAMHNFGFRHLRMVSEYTVPLEESRAAVDATEVLREAQSYSQLAEAVADCTLVIGSTAIGNRSLQQAVHPLPQAAALMQRELGNRAHRVALLFGSEKTGLSNEELSHCHWLLTIPMQKYDEGRHASMNLGQAVAICLYELSRSAPAPVSGAAENDAATTDAATSDAPAATKATAAEREQLMSLLREALEESEYTRHHPAHSDAASLRRLVRQMELGSGDVPVWLGILRQVLWRLRGQK